MKNFTHHILSELIKCDIIKAIKTIKQIKTTDNIKDTKDISDKNSTNIYNSSQYEEPFEMTFFKVNWKDYTSPLSKIAATEKSNISKQWYINKLYTKYIQEA